MTANPNDIKQHDSSLWSFGILTLLCCLGVIGISFFHQKDQRERTSGQTRIGLRHIPPELIGYQQTAIFATPVPGKPTSFALLNESTFVVGSTDPPMLSLFDETGTLLRTIDLPEEPRAIVCGTPETIFSGKIVVAHPTRIAVYSADGRMEHSWKKQPIWRSKDEPSMYRMLRFSGNEKIFPDHVTHVELRGTGASGIWWVDPEVNIRSLVLTQNSLFAADTGKRRIYRLDTHGELNLTFAFGRDQTVEDFFSQMEGALWLTGGFPGFIVYAAPITMTFSQESGLLYIANPGKHRVEVFTQDGIYQPELSWGEPSGRLDGFAGCCNPIDLAVLDDGRILTVEKAIPRVKIYRTDGELDTVVAGPNILDDIPAELGRTPTEPGGRYLSAIPLPNGRIAVFDYDYAAVRMFTPL